MNKQKGFLRLTIVLSIIVGVLSGVIGYIAADQPNPFDDIIPDTKLNFTPNLFPEQPNIFDDILPNVKPEKDYFAEEISQKQPQEQPVSSFIPDTIIPEWSKVTAGMLWLIIGFVSVWIIYGFIRWCIINLTTWIIAGFKTNQ